MQRKAATLLFGMAAPAAVYLGLVLMHSVAATFAALYIGVFTLISVLDLFVSEKSRKDILGEELGLRITPQALLMGLLSGLFFAAVVFFFFSTFRMYLFRDEILSVVLSEWNITRNDIWPMILVLVVFNPFFEEFYWRGYYLRRLRKSLNRHQAILVSSMFYASYHLITTVSLFSFQPGLFLTFSVFCAGMLWGYMRIFTDSTVSCAISHLLADAGLILAFFLYLVPFLS